jgi:hypothetical protein
MLGEERQRHRREEGKLAHHAVAAAPAAAATGARAQREALETHGVAVLQKLGVGDAGVGHVGVHAACAVEIRAGAGAAADGFVVAEGGVAEEQVVHRALAAGGESQRLEQGVHQPLAGFDVAAHDGGRPPGIGRERRVQQAGRDLDVDRAQQPLVERQGLGDQQAKDVEDRAAHHGGRRVEIAGMDPGGAGEIDACAPRPDLDGDRDRRAVVQPLDRLQAPHRQARERRAQAALGTPLERLHVERHDRRAVGPLAVLSSLAGKPPVPAGAPESGCGGALRGQRQRAQGFGAAAVGRRRGAQIGEVLLDGAGRKRPARQQTPHLLPARLASADEVGGRDDHALLGQAGGAGRHRTRPHAADLGVVRTARDIAQEHGRRAARRVRSERAGGRGGG